MLEESNMFVICVNLRTPVLDFVSWAVLSKVGAQFLFRVLSSTFFSVNLMKVNAFMIQEFVVH